MGTFTSKGNFIVQQHRQRQYIAPTTMNSELKCYVSTKKDESRNDFSVTHYFRASENEYLKQEAKKCYKEMFTRGVIKYKN